MSFFQWKNIELAAGNIGVAEITYVDHENLQASVTKYDGMIPIHYHCTETDVDHENLQASVTKYDGMIPIHYHCTETDVEDDGSDFDSKYPDEMDERGASAFAVGDKVLILFRKSGNEDPIIIGFAEGDKACCNFKFHIEGEGEGELTENVFFSIYNEEQTSQPVVDLQYDDDQGCWVFSLDTEQEGVTCEGPYWARYFAPGFKSTQYKGIDDSDNFFQEPDRLIMGDGTLYSDILAIIEGTEGEYWEPWGETLCGNNTWDGIYSNVHGEGENETKTGECLSLPIVTSISNATTSTDIANGVLTITNETTADWYFSYFWMEAQKMEDGFPRPLGKMIIKFASQAVAQAGVESISEGGMYVYFNGSPSKTVLLVWAYNDTNNGLSGESGVKEVQASQGDDTYKIVWVDTANYEEPVVIDFLNDPEFEGWFGEEDEIWQIQFTSLAWDFALTSVSIDYIHFPYWEDWINWYDKKSPSLCANHDWCLWDLNDSSNYIYTKCPSLPFSSNIQIWAGETGNYSVEIVDGILSLSYSAPENEWRNVDIGIYWNGSPLNYEEEEGYSPVNLDITSKMIVKFTCIPGNCRAAGFWIGNETQFYILAVHQRSDWPRYGQSYVHEIDDNGGEEQIIDLSGFGITGTLMYIGFFFNLYTESCQGNLTIDYINFTS